MKQMYLVQIDILIEINVFSTNRNPMQESNEIKKKKVQHNKYRILNDALRDKTWDLNLIFGKKRVLRKA